MSQYKARKKSRKDKIKYKKKKSIWKNFVFRITLWGAVLIISLVYLLLFSPLLAINQIKITASTSLGSLTPTVEGLVNQKLEKHWAFLSIKKTFFLLNTANLKKEIKAMVPQVEEVTIKKEFFHTLVLQLKERTPRAVWCYAQSNRCYLIDYQGTIFQAASEKTLPLIMTENEATEEIALPSQVIEPAKMARILQTISFFQERLGIVLQNCLTDGQDKLFIKTQEGWEVRLSLTGNIDSSLTKLGLLIEKNLPQEKRKNLQYIDLRFSKVYYK